MRIPDMFLSFARRAAPVVMAMLLAACGAQVELLAQISETQANEVLAALLKRGIAAEKIPGKEGVVSVRVAQDQVADALGILQAQGLPRTPHVSMGDVFKKEGLISSPGEERARLVYALSQELSGTLSQIDGVISAQVHVVLSERGGFGETGNPSSAAVFIKHLDTFNIDNVVPQIRRLVTNSIAGLDYDNVSVVLVPSAPRVDAAAAADSSKLETVWGMEVAPQSAGLLRIALVSLAMGLLLSIAGAAYSILRGRRAAVRSDA